VNTTWPSTLLAYITPFEVWFGWKPHWLIEPQLNISNNLIDDNGNELLRLVPESNDEENGFETDIEAEEYILTNLEKHIRQNNA
jgi:hypothetical protein